MGYRFSVIAGTIFENTNKTLRDWFRVVLLMLAGKKGTSALQIQRIMGFGSYGTAHSMCHKIRAALIHRRQGQEQARRPQRSRRRHVRQDADHWRDQP
jgi:hypothetical protein